MSEKSINNNDKISSSILSNIRYTLSSKLMEEYFLQFLSIQANKDTITKLISDIKDNITMLVCLFLN